MRVFLYEFTTGGGLFHTSDSPSDSLLSEGRAMIRALASDFLRVEGCQVTALRDQRQKEFHPGDCQVHEVGSAESEQTLFRRMAADADWTLVIAPEFEEYLLQRTQWVEEESGHVLGPNSRLVALASDKQRTADHLAQAGLPVPESRRLGPSEPLPTDFNYPAVIKPLDGAGSIETHFVAKPDERFIVTNKARRLERYYSGTAASVAFLCGPTGVVALPPCQQHISDDRCFSYLGGSFPLTAELSQRASKLARRAISTLDNPLGYLGVDLILGDDSRGQGDVVLEINPRLTTSYVGLRAAICGNLASAMMQIGSGCSVALEFDSHPLTFNVEGEIERLAGSRG